MTARPVITMDETDRSVWMEDTPRPGLLGYVLDGDMFVWQSRVYTFAEVRAIADFLDQLAGANLLSEVGE